MAREQTKEELRREIALLRARLSRLERLPATGLDNEQRFGLIDRQWHESLERAFEVFAAAVELRDPYVSGHQQRVARLAGAIAEEMSLPPEQASIVRLAASIHDVGKVGVSAEILNRARALDEAERRLVELHPEFGHKILRQMELTCPVAEIVLQHHERCDGSGYPRGLKGDDILLEARIIAVADVIEALSSRRPHRPAIGTAAAFEEIICHRGLCYDPAVVDACVSVVCEKGVDFGYDYHL